MYLEKRRKRWYAIHEIPEDVRKALGCGKQFFKSLETEDKTMAKRRAALLEVRWLHEIETARKGGTLDHVERDALYWRKVLADTPEDQREIVIGLIADEAQDRVETALAREGIWDERDPRAADLPVYDEAGRFYGIATGKIVRLTEHLDEWLATLDNEAKTKDMKRSTIQRFAEKFPYVTDVRGKPVQLWVNALAAQEGKKAKTIRRILSELRGYWAYLVSIEVVQSDHQPFIQLQVPKANGSKVGSESWVPFSPADVVRLLQAAEARKDDTLADLIRIAMWTGGRIESLCALKVNEVGDGFFDILHDKSEAGRRTVPIHSKLKPTMDRLLKNAKADGYVLPGLTENKYGDRSDAIGKRFGRLKTALGFTEQHVFHSIRKTVATLLENAGVPENVAADIIGHDKPTMTYGLYSGGASLEVKRQALEKIDYPV
ncbi:Integrase [uncultured Alphaproteobacteria bacterium]|uniref:Integrase n=1 Tax=uncultured Alphaproteobacteria bacterium TaxID=91750 RepID=A0A212JIE3_9PROT|nr:Integrase [uncultured Alphaproteobacteria bacterium]